MKKRPKIAKKIKESKVDAIFSLWIRNRDGVCQYPLRSPEDFHAGPLQNSHFHGRTARSTRWDEENCDGICARHHQFLEGRKNAEYADWKRKQLGDERFEALKRRYYQLKQWKQPELKVLIEKYSPAD